MDFANFSPKYTRRLNEARREISELLLTDCQLMQNGLMMVRETIIRDCRSDREWIKKTRI